MNHPERSRTVSWTDPLEALASVAGKAGLEALQALIERGTPPPIGVLMNFQAARFEPGLAVFTGVPAEYHYNPLGVVHGGFAATLLDSAMGCAVHTTLTAGQTYTTLELKVNFVRPITLETGAVSAEGRVVHRGGRIATAEGRLLTAAGDRLLAHATTTCLLFSPEGAGTSPP